MAGGQDCFSFGQFQLDTGEHILRREGAVVALPPKALDLLIVLVQNGGRLLAKEELMKLVWPGTFVEDNNLTVHISLLRKTLGESYIDTVPRRGYRFTAPVSLAGPTVIHELRACLEIN
jgi:DNA-binding winged helix-turn-helix (wHTH) protein